MLRIVGILLLLFGALVPPLLFPGLNQWLVGFVGAPFILVGLVLMLIASFPARVRPEKDKDDVP